MKISDERLNKSIYSSLFRFFFLLRTSTNIPPINAGNNILNTVWIIEALKAYSDCINKLKYTKKVMVKSLIPIPLKLIGSKETTAAIAIIPIIVRVFWKLITVELKEKISKLT